MISYAARLPRLPAAIEASHLTKVSAGGPRCLTCRSVSRAVRCPGSWGRTGRASP